MRRWVLTHVLGLALLCSSAGQARAAAWLPLPTDKVAHFGVSYVMTDQLMRAGFRPEHALMLTLLVGLIKEAFDDHIDPGDLGANAAGSLAAAYLNVRWGW